MNLAEDVGSFFDRVVRGEIEIYNEFSLQHELGIHLRSTLADQYKVQFERPADFFSLTRLPKTKSEIDIAVFTPDRRAKYAIELKFPRNGQYPEQMFKACQDIAFLEELVLGGFNYGLFVMAADDPLFYQGLVQQGIYAYFRKGVPIQGEIVKPTGQKNERVRIGGSYRLVWNDAGPVRYCYAIVR